MKKFFFKHILNSVIFISALSLISSCTSTNKLMREPNSRVEFKKDDFTFSPQVTAEATSNQIFGIDFSRLFNQTTGSVNPTAFNVPVFGSVFFAPSPAASYALYELFKKNEGYDVVFYPQYETTVKRPIGLGFIYKKTTVKVTAKLAKVK